MKNFFLSLFFLPLIITAQDTISLKMQGSFASQIQSVDSFHVRYKKFDNPFGPTYTAQKKSVTFIRYENGERIDADSLTKINQPNISGMSSVDDGPVYSTVASTSSLTMLKKGDEDARVYYNSSCGAIGTGVTAFLLVGIGGLIPAVICSSVPPRVENLRYPSEQLWANQYYQQGYKKRAKKIKQRKVWRGFAIGFSCAATALSFMLENN
jgi:hypothetical protein